MTTRKLYVEVAQTIGLSRDLAQDQQAELINDTLRDIARKLADIFARDNPRFDRARFLTACGFSPYE